MKKLMSGLAIATIASTAFVGIASAQSTDTASGGNGGISTANANGGAVGIGGANTGGSAGGTASIGGNTGGTTSIGGSSGGTIVLGGDVMTGEDLAARIIASLGIGG
jgi:hypothetical protein